MATTPPLLAAGARPRAARPAPRRGTPMPWLRPGLILGALVPLAAMIVGTVRGTLGANPIAEVINELGLIALVFLIAGLACSPLRWAFGWTWPIRLRRDLGLLAFFYALLHFLVYVVLDQGVDLGIIVEDVVQRPFITVGFLALLLMVPLAWTSTSGWVRRLGYQTWTRLHQLVYVAGILAVIHFLWRVKIDISQPMLYATILGALLLARVAFWLRGRQMRKA
ncbi:MAG: sulfoxide reductase heme-binding subunit YedZ [Chloroflexi bacterium]|nr:sulfoxide reductase heme-binding subunit YedZ [Chloroflexota bacterium]